VLASKGGAECRKGAQVSVAFPDLQNMQNHMRETIDQGLGDLQTRQGQGGLPAAPIAARSLPVQTSFAAIAPPPDPNAATQINQQSQEAERAEQETLSQASVQEGSQTPAAAAAVNISMGMSIDEVTAAFGEPPRKFDGGTKKIYIYKDMKITFNDGKVTDVQ
jgi:hypothetical protein